MANPVFFRADGWVKSTTGAAVPGAQIYVADQPANSTFLPPSPLSNIFSDPDGLVPIVQPILTDGFGHYDFYILPGTYTVVVGLGGAIQQVYPDQSIGLGEGGGTVYTGGTGIFVVGSVISINLVAGLGISIVGNVITATGGGGGGTVTSVAMTGDGEVFNTTVTGSPITTAGTLVPVLKAQAANTILAGPANDAAPDAAPTFRGLVMNDMPFALPFRSWHGWAAHGRANSFEFAYSCNPTVVGGSTPQPISTSKPATVRISSAFGINSQGYILDNEGESYNNVNLAILNFYQWGCSINQTITTRWWLAIFDGRSDPTSLKGDTPANNLVGFRFSTPAGDTTWQCVTQTDAANQTITDTGLIMSTGYQIFRISYDVDTGAVNFFIDDLLVASHLTDVPDNSVPMMGTISVTNPDTDGGTKSSTDIAYSYFEERPPSSLPLSP
jgi:hypothetical protein